VAPVHELLDEIINYPALAFQHGQDAGPENFLKLLHLAPGKHIKGPAFSEKAVSDYGMKKIKDIPTNLNPTDDDRNETPCGKEEKKADKEKDVVKGQLRDREIMKPCLITLQKVGVDLKL